MQAVILNLSKKLVFNPKNIKYIYKQNRFQFCSTVVSESSYPEEIEQFQKIEILRSNLTDINFNLATEEFLYEHSKVTHPILFLWRNDKTIVIGRHQNPWKECFVQNMEEDNIQLSRRKTGGGAVYQDLGNSCFSFLHPGFVDKEGKSLPLDQSKSINNQILINALKNLGITATVSGRNDLLCNDKKISGSAYKLNLGNKDGEGKKALHHGTMLINVQAQNLPKYLNPNKAKLESKSVKSVISRVINLVEVKPDLNHEIFCAEVEKEFKKAYKNASEIITENLDENVLKNNAKINEIYTNSISWEWLHGQTPKFTNSIETRFEWGIIDFNFEVEKSKIVKAIICSDCLFADFISQMNAILEQNAGVYNYDQEGMKQFCQDIRVLIKGNEIFEQYVNDIQSWIVKAI